MWRGLCSCRANHNSARIRAWRSTVRRRMIWRTSMAPNHRECAISSLCSCAIGYDPKGARTDSAAALDVENEVIRRLQIMPGRWPLPGQPLQISL